MGRALFIRPVSPVIESFNGRFLKLRRVPFCPAPLYILTMLRLCLFSHGVLLKSVLKKVTNCAFARAWQCRIYVLSLAIIGLNKTSRQQFIGIAGLYRPVEERRSYCRSTRVSASIYRDASHRSLSKGAERRSTCELTRVVSI